MPESSTPSTSCKKDMDARHKAGHDDVCLRERWVLFCAKKAGRGEPGMCSYIAIETDAGRRTPYQGVSQTHLLIGRTGG
jgi:hypothetical protein